MKKKWKLKIMLEQTNETYLCGVNKKNIEKKFQFGDYVLWFPKGENTHLGKFKKRWFGPFRVQYYLPNNTIILVLVINFEPNPILVNINKLKPYKYVDQTLKGS
jgi:hypothetical protein